QLYPSSSHHHFYSRFTHIDQHVTHSIESIHAEQLIFFLSFYFYIPLHHQKNLKRVA
ncbi:hypothetical protein QBC38DRAFT_383330, partial [Podospora fimiseda]